MTGDPGEVVLVELRRGPRTTPELMAATGLTRNAVGCAIRRAIADGNAIANSREPGGRHDGLYELVHDRTHPTTRRCAVLGCRTTLSASNATSYCRHHLPQAARTIAELELDLLIDTILDTQQLELLLDG